MTEPDRSLSSRLDALVALGEACRTHPDQRVAQVIVNALGEDPFYLENRDAAERLRAYARGAR